MPPAPPPSAPRSGRWASALGGLAALLAILLGGAYGNSIVRRLSDHRGFELIAVADRVEAAASAAVRPRRALLVLIDGLRADVAARMRSMKRLSAAGVCRPTLVSLPTVSRPVYAMVSTGVEQDRTGARNNAETSPLGAESIWQVARASGRRVAGFSELPWWQQLFPDGFDRYEVHPRSDDYLARAARATEDLVLVHPVYVDEAGHDHGAASPEYARAAARADEELGRLLDTLDLEREVIVVTADHGHSDRGGHGADQPEVATTLTCYAGRGVVRRTAAAPEGPGRPTGPMAQRAVGPLLAVLAGLRFPRHMRPAFDPQLWLDLGGLPAAYLADRRAAEARFVAASAGLPAIYARGRLGQAARGAAVLLLLCLLLLLSSRRRGQGAVEQAALVAWMAAVIALHVVAYVLARGSFDMTSINQRAAWVSGSLRVGLAAAAAGTLAHLALFRDPVRLGGDQLTLLGLGAGVLLAHVAAFGWILGFPLPGPLLLYLPFFGAMFLITQGTLVLLSVVGAALLALLGARGGRARGLSARR